MAFRPVVMSYRAILRPEASASRVFLFLDIDHRLGIQFFVQGNMVFQLRGDRPQAIAKSKILSLIHNLSLEAKIQGVTLLASPFNPTYALDNPYSVLFDYVVRVVSPLQVWRPDFDWKNESYDDFCRRIHWKRELFRNILVSIDKLKTYKTTLFSHVID